MKVQSTTHKVFGQSVFTSSTTGKQYHSVDPAPNTTLDWNMCTECSRKFSTIQALRAHEKTHVVEVEEKAPDGKIVEEGEWRSDGHKNNGGKRNRVRYSLERKRELLDHIENVRSLGGRKKRISLNRAAIFVSESEYVPVSTLSKWARDEDFIRDGAASKATKQLKQVYYRSWWESQNNLEDELARRVRSRRKKGLKARRRWVMATSRQLRKIDSIVATGASEAHHARANVVLSWFCQAPWFLIAQRK